MTPTEHSREGSVGVIPVAHDNRFLESSYG